MKKLIKSGVYGTHEQCIYALFTKDRSTVAAEEKKKKKKRENADAARLSAIQTYTKWIQKNNNMTFLIVWFILHTNLKENPV